MSAAKRRFFSGNTVEQALVQAAGHFQIEPERLAYRQIEKKHGFVRTRRRVVIEVDPDNPTVKPESRLTAGGGKAGDGESGDRRSPRAEAKPAPQAAQREQIAQPSPSDSPKESQQQAAEEISQARTETAPESTLSEADEAESVSEEAAPPEEKEEAAGGSAWWRAVHRDEDDDESDSDDDDDDDGDEDDLDDDEDDEDLDDDEDDEDLDDEDDDEDDEDDDSEDEEIDDDEVIAGAEDAMERILRLAGLDLDCTVTLEDETIYADLTGPDREVLLDEDADLLQSIEMLLPRVMRGLVGDSYPCRVDSGGFRRKREKELQDLARKAAEVVREGVQAVTLEPMNPAERRIVHLALADAKDVKTESEGDGYFKQVVILRS